MDYPVNMEEYKTLHQLLESLCEKNHLKSWTVHNNFAGSVVTLRFSEMDGAAVNEDTTTTFKRKSVKQQNRDRERLERFRRPNTQNMTTENKRDSDIDSIFSVSETGLSPEPVIQNLDLDTLDTSLRMDTPDSVDIEKCTQSQGACALSALPEPQVEPIELPSMPDPMDYEDQTCEAGNASKVTVKKSTKTPQNMRKIPERIDNILFREHLSICTDTFWCQIWCHDCSTNIKNQTKSDTGEIWGKMGMIRERERERLRERER